MFFFFFLSFSLPHGKGLIADFTDFQVARVFMFSLVKFVIKLTVPSLLKDFVVIVSCTAGFFFCLSV